MHFSSIAVPFMAAVATVQAQTVTVYSDAKCTRQAQVINFNKNGPYQCINFKTFAAQAVKFSVIGWANKGFNVWDSQYCQGDQAGDPTRLGKCLAARDYGLFYFKSAHISPRNAAPPPSTGA